MGVAGFRMDTTQEKMDRISAQYRKSKAEVLTEAEKQEQAALRQEYRDSVRKSLAGQLEHTYIIDETGKHKAEEYFEEKKAEAKKHQP